MGIRIDMFIKRLTFQPRSENSRKTGFLLLGPGRDQHHFTLLQTLNPRNYLRGLLPLRSLPILLIPVMKYFFVVIIFLSSIQILVAQVEEPVIEEAVVEELYEVSVTSEEIQSGISTFTENGLTGVKNYSTNTIIIPAEYQIINKVDDTNFIVKKGLSGVFNSALEKLVLPLEFDEISFMHRNQHFEFKDGTEFIIIVKKSNKYGLMDQSYRYLINCEYDQIEPSRKYAKLTKGGKTGIYFLDRNSKDIPVTYDKIDRPYAVNCLVANQGDHFFLYDESGKTVAKDCKEISMYRDQSQQRINNNILIVDQKGKCGIYDSEEHAYLLQVRYEEITDGFEDHFVVRKKSKYGLVAKGDKLVIPFNYDSLLFLFPKSLKSPLLATRNNKFGLVDLTNRVVADFQYDALQSINGFYKAKKQGKYAVLDNFGKPITTSNFDDVGSLHNGQLAVFNEGKIGYIDVTGKITTPIERNSPARGYKDLDLLFEGFANAIKADSDSVLREFCRDVVYDAYSQEFFQRIGFQYRGFPNKMIEHNYTVEDAAREYYKKVDKFYRRLKESGQLDSFEFVELKTPGFDYFDLSKGLRATETWGIYKTKARTFEIKLGELIDTDGYWKSFTMFRW
jgi:hypothetical protein